MGCILRQYIKILRLYVKPHFTSRAFHSANAERRHRECTQLVTHTSKLQDLHRSDYASLLQSSSRPPRWILSSSASFSHRVPWASSVHLQTNPVWPLRLYLLHPTGAVPLMYSCIHSPLHPPWPLPERSSTFHSLLSFLFSFFFVSKPHVAAALAIILNALFFHSCRHFFGTLLKQQARGSTSS